MKPIRFNTKLRLHAPLQQAKLSRLLAIADARTRTRRRADSLQYEHCLNVLLANLVQLNCIAADWPLEVRVGKNSLQYGDCFGAQHLHILRSMAQLGWVSSHTTERYVDEKPITITTISLLDMPLQGIGLEQVSTVLGQDVTLKSSKESGAVPLHISKTHPYLAQMLAINSYLNAVDVEYSPQGYPVKHWLECDDLWPYAKIRNIRDNSVHRVFNENFCRGGRMYGGWWLGMSKIERQANIRIAGEAIAYVDFNALNLRLAYAQANMTFPIGDGYRAGFLGSRKDWKAVTLVMLMAKKVLTQYPGKVKEQQRLRRALGIPSSMAYKAVADRHPGLESIWFTGAASMYTCIESNIMVQVLLQAEALGLSVLPVYDCCICPKSEASLVASLMEAEAKRAGYYLPADIT